MIRVENIYYLLCYAWGHVEQASERVLGRTDLESVSDLLGHVLAARVRSLLRRGVPRQYVLTEDVLFSPRGRIDVQAQFRRGPVRGRGVACRYDELDHDILLNRVITWALRTLMRSVGDSGVRVELAEALGRWPHTAEVQLRAEHFARLRRERVDAHVRFIVHLCGFLFDQVGPRPGEKLDRFTDVTSDPRKLGLLFETFLRKFWESEQRAFSVGRSSPKWQLEGSAEALSVLPAMQPDIVLTSSQTRALFEVKYYAEPFRRGRYDGSLKLREGHLYQLFAYIENLRTRGTPLNHAVLLYAQSEEPFDYRYQLGSTRVRVRTIDLNQAWRSLRAALLEMADELHP